MCIKQLYQGSNVQEASVQGSIVQSVQGVSLHCAVCRTQVVTSTLFVTFQLFSTNNCVNCKLCKLQVSTARCSVKVHGGF